MTDTRQDIVRHCPPVGQLVAPLSAFDRESLDLAGGKGANLGELVRNGFSVPGGFVVTTAAYAMIIERSGLASRIAERLATGEDDGAAIRACFTDVALPDELSEAITAAYTDLGGGPVAVRSSATAEDLPGAAFAGQQDTYLNVIGRESLLDAVRRCWGSLWTARAIAYRRHRGVDSGDVRIAVVVQKMVEAETVGVMFTANPVTGERGDTVIDASSGLGEAVVSGLVTPDHYLLDSEGQVQEWRPGRREVVIRGASAGGVTHDPGETPAEQPLPDAVLRELAELGTSVADHFGRPQDIEWAYAAGNVCLLQARPMTAVPPPPLQLSPVQRRIGTIMLDYLTTRPYPIDVTTWLMHGPLAMIAEMVGSVGIRIKPADVFQEEDGVVNRFIPPNPRPSAALLLAPLRFAYRAWRYDPAQWTQDRRFTEWQRRAHELASRDLGALSWADLSRMPRQAMALMNPCTDIRIDYLPRVGLCLLRLVLALKMLGRSELMSDLVIGAPTRTSDANRALESLAEMVREERRLKRAFAELEPDQLLDAVRDDPAFADFHTALLDFLAEYGHRETASPILVTPPTWSEAPETVLALVSVLVEETPTPVASSRADEAVRQLLAHPVVRRTGLRSLMLRVVDAARVGVAFREDTHFHFTRALPVLRRSLLEIGRRLRDAGILREPEDVFHLRLEELEGIGDLASLPRRTADRLRATVLARSAKRDELAGVRLIDASLIFSRNVTDGGALVSGTPACGGRVTGPVRVIRDSTEFGNLRGGDVLVCPYTNPAWTPLFQRAAAVVAETGGPASHAAIVAREYGIPAVMGVAGATTELADGQLVTVDGDTGRVYSADLDADAYQANAS